MTGDASISNALQDYLEAILNLAEKNERVRITDLAHTLGIAKPSATEMVKNMSQKGLLIHERYGGLELTEEGERQAREVRHRHMIIRDFLVEVLGVEFGTAEKEACLMEHAVGPDTISRLANYMEVHMTSGNGR